MALSSAILEFQITHFPISHILWAQTPGRISEINMIAQSSMQNKFILWFQKLPCFGTVAVQSGREWIKVDQNFAVLSPSKV